MADLSSSFAGLSLKNPVIIGSSGLTNNENNILSLEKNGAAAVVLKSLFEEEIVREMNIGLGKMSGDGFLYPETLEFYEDSYGEEESTVKYLELIKKVKASCSIPVIASINCLSANQWTTFPELIEEAGADALELNIFLLPADLNKEATEQEETYYTIVNEVLKQVKIPVVAKISPYFS
ncbi:MAG: diguanylate cyclase, partial [Bacteroidota bacterium]